ncbi:MAG: hypothetical protein U0599_14280 [Vicinamibacteria bacterium]
MSVLVGLAALLVVPFVLLVVGLKVLFALLFLPFKIVGGLVKGLFGLVFGVLGGLFGLVAGGAGLLFGLLVTVLVLVVLPLAPLLLLGAVVWLVLRAASPATRAA